MTVIGLLHSGSEGSFLKAVQALKDHLPNGVEILPRYAGDNMSQLEYDAGGLVANDDVKVIVAAGGPGPAIVAMKETKQQEPDLDRRKPVVFTTVADPVKSNLVDTLLKPGRNLTGMAGKTSELDLSRMEILNAMVPYKIGEKKEDRTLGVLVNTICDHGDDYYQVLKDRARDIGIKLRRVKAGSENDIKEAFRETFDGVKAVVVTANSLFNNRRQVVVDEAKSAGFPAIFQWREFTQVGGLVSFGPSLNEAYEKAGDYVSLILGGRKPADIPVSEPSGYELVFNPLPAKELGIDLPEKEFMQSIAKTLDVKIRLVLKPDAD